MRKNRIFLYILLVLLLISGCAAQPDPQPTSQSFAAIGGKSVFGTFVTTDMAGNPVNEEIFRGHKLTMVNIWGTFCQPCIREMPELAQLHTQYGDAFQVVGIIVDAADKNGNILPDKKAEAARIMAATAADYPQLLPSKSLNSAYLNNVRSVPETIFLDENGNRIGESYLGAKNKNEWMQIIDSLLKTLSAE